MDNVTRIPGYCVTGVLFNGVLSPGNGVRL